MVLHLLFGGLFPGPRSERLSDLAAIGEMVTASALLLYPNRHAPTDASRKVTLIGHEASDRRRQLESRLAKAGVHVTDPRLVCEAASEMLEVMRLIGRVIRCREWLGLADAPEALELEGTAGLGAQHVAEGARELAGMGTLTWVDGGASMRIRAEELYARGVARAFESADALDVLRQKTLYDALLGVVIGSDRALEALRDASIE